MKQSYFTVNDDYIRLDDLLKVNGCVETGGQAKLLIQSGGVLLNGEICLQRGKKLRGGESVKILQTDEEIILAHS